MFDPRLTEEMTQHSSWRSHRSRWVSSDERDADEGYITDMDGYEQIETQRPETQRPKGPHDRHLLQYLLTKVLGCHAKPEE